MFNIVDVIKALINTLIRLSPIAFYTGCAISGGLFNDFRAVLLLGGFILNECLALGYKMIFKGVGNQQCALLMSTDNSPFILPSPISQTVGFLYGFILADMYYSDVFNYVKFFTMSTIIILAIYSRINVGCKSLLDAIYCALIGTLSGIIYYSFVKDIYTPTYLSSNLDETIRSILD